MAITIQSSPQAYSPAGNQNIWQITSDNTNIQYFRISVIEAGTTNVISNVDMYVTPDYQNGSYFNLQTILQDLVKWEIKNDDSIVSTFLTKPIFKYRLKIVEKIYNTDSATIVDGDTYDDDSDEMYIWYANMNRAGFNSYYPSDYIIQTDNTANFLTNKPDLVSVNDYSTEMLYLLSNGSITSLNLIVNTYDKTKTLLNTYTSAIQSLSTYKMFSVYASPTALNKSMSVDFTNVNYYTISLQDVTGSDVIQSRKYLYQKIDCSLQPVNILFVNQLGGIDSYQFVNPQKTISISKTTIIKNPYKLDPSNNYTDNENGVYNVDEEIVNLTENISYFITSKPLSDDEAEWIKELFISNQAFIEVSNGAIYPIQISDTTYKIQKQRYLGTNLNLLQLTFTIGNIDISNNSIIPLSKASVLMNNDMNLIVSDTNQLILV